MIIESVTTRIRSYHLAAFQACGVIVTLSLIGCGPGEVQSEQISGGLSGKVVALTDYADLSDAVSSAGSEPATLVISKDAVVDSDVTIPSTLNLAFQGAGQLTVGSGHLVAINGAIVA